MSLRVAITHRAGDFALDVAFDAPGGVTALFGRSGAGKTSVANAVAGLLRPDNARIVLDDNVLVDTGAGLWLPPHRRRIGYVFQEGRLFPHLDVAGNLDYPARVTGRKPEPAARARVVEMLGIGPLLTRRPRTLSGGEKQRVALGRALLSDPRLLVMDEPLAALDTARKEEILPYIERLRDEAGLPILYVSHSVEEVARLANTLVLLSEGRVAQAGSAAAMFADLETGPILGLREAGAILSGRVAQHHDDGLSEIAVSGGTLHLPRVAAAPGAPIRVRIEAQDVMIALDRPRDVSALNILPAEVVALKQGTGPGVMVQLRLGADLILARVTRRSASALALEPGRACHVVIKSVAVAPGNVTSG